MLGLVDWRIPQRRAQSLDGAEHDARRKIDDVPHEGIGVLCCDSAGIKSRLRKIRQIEGHDHIRASPDCSGEHIPVKPTSSKWAAIARCSPDTALCDINDLLARGVLRKSDAGGRSTSCVLVE